MPERKRPDVVTGNTYTLKWVGEIEDETYYVVINHAKKDGKLCPYEIFFNSRNVVHYPWMVALARMISAVFQRGENVAFVAHELQEVFDPRGGQVVGSKRFRSLLDMIGQAIEQDMISIGYIPGPVEQHGEDLAKVLEPKEIVAPTRSTGIVPAIPRMEVTTKETGPTSAQAIAAAKAAEKAADKVRAKDAMEELMREDRDGEPDDDFDVRGL